MTWHILQGDCRQLLSLMVATESVQTCITSPPYFGLRDYGADGQIGLEASVDEYVGKLVEVFRCVRNCLREDGTLWLNLGDSYAGSGRGGGGNAKHNPTGDSAREAAVTKRAGRPRIPAIGSQLPAGLHEAARQEGAVGRAWVPPPPGFKMSDLMGIPWRVAFALQADGWYLRQDIIWHKPNPMPESVTSRCTKAHEYIFLLSKSRKYYYDHEAIMEPAATSSVARLSQDVEQQEGSDRVPGKTNGKMKAVGHLPGNKTHRGQSAYEAGDGRMRTKAVLVDYCARVAADPSLMMKRNKRSVWTVTTKPFKEAHFATFPPDLIEPCVLAGSAPGDTVLDPFGGAGTTALVAQRHGRSAVLCELNPAYIAIAEARLRG